MRTSRILLRLLLLVGSLIFLLDAHHRGLATYDRDCGYYPPGTANNCPSPCLLKYYTFTWQQAGPEYVNGNQVWCTGDPNLDCYWATAVTSPTTPERSDACGCGDTGQWCGENSDCCVDDWCLDNKCVDCLPNGVGTCETNADCCSGTFCDCNGYCTSGGEGDDCCYNADCSSHACYDDSCCPSSCPFSGCSNPSAYCNTLCGCPDSNTCSNCYDGCYSAMSSGCESACQSCGICCPDPVHKKPRSASVMSALPDLF